MTSEKYAYRASEALSAAQHAYHQARKDFQRDVLGPWEDAHAPVHSIWQHTVFGDLECVGFFDADPASDPPKGLFRSRNRDELVPTNRGKTGDPWRTEMVTLNKRPKISTVLEAHGVMPAILDVDHSRWSRAGVLTVPDGHLLSWGIEHPACEHLTRIPLSEYYAAREALPADNPAKL
jgi:hypothetical protein